VVAELGPDEFLFTPYIHTYTSYAHRHLKVRDVARPDITAGLLERNLSTNFPADGTERDVPELE
jgi:hypothetical protein